MNDNPQRFWNRVSGSKESCLEIFKGQLSVVVDFVKFGVAQETVFFEFSTDQSQGKWSSVDRDICLLEQERNPTDVVLVSVCNQNSLDAVNIVHDVRIITTQIGRASCRERV